jgi:hypothetical protein
MKWILKRQQGDVTLEFVLVLPLILMLFFTCLQFAHFWIAKQLLHYAAYSAARITRVTNIHDYADVNASGKVVYRHIRTPLHTAACMVMSWLEPDAGMDEFQYFPKDSAACWNRVRIEGTEEGGTGCMATEVTVHYYCPLWVPMVDELLAYGLAGGTDTRNGIFDSPADFEAVVNGGGIYELVYSDAVPQNAIYRDNGQLVIHMKESCLMAKPYSTETYARLPEGGANP